MASPAPECLPLLDLQQRPPSHLPECHQRQHHSVAEALRRKRRNENSLNRVSKSLPGSPERVVARASEEGYVVPSVSAEEPKEADPPPSVSYVTLQASDKSSLRKASPYVRSCEVSAV